MKVIRVNGSKKHRASKDVEIFIKKICQYFLVHRVRNQQLLKLKKEITVVFLTEKEMQKINNEFRRKNKPTDILSFTSDDPNSLGELLLCLPVLQKQAQQQQHSISQEVAYMLIHGVLHLLGYDHELSLKEEKLMFKLQDSCFKDLGLV